MLFDEVDQQFQYQYTDGWNMMPAVGAKHVLLLLLQCTRASTALLMLQLHASPVCLERVQFKKFLRLRLQLIQTPGGASSKPASAWSAPFLQQRRMQRPQANNSTSQQT
jgi:hypothetical protein